MAMMADDAVFLDTNILIYAELSTSPFYAVSRRKLEQLHAAARSFWISRQIIREYLVTTTCAHAGHTSVAATEAAMGVQTLLRNVSVANENAEVTAELLKLVGTFGIKRYTTPTSWLQCWCTKFHACSLTTEQILIGFSRESK